MPRVRRKTKRRRASELSDFQVDFLRIGIPLFTKPWSDDLEAVEDDWDYHRDALVAETPFHRPYAWWKFDAPETLRVRQLGETPNAVAVAIDSKYSEAAGYRYSTQVLQRGGYHFNLEHETEVEYLIRLDLLTDEEKRILAESVAG